MVDKPYINYLVKNKIIDEPNLIRKIDKAFQFFGTMEIYTIEINLNNWGKGMEQNINSCLKSWARYINELAKGSKHFVYNELNEPDPNLTNLARLNRFKRHDLQNLVHQIQRRYMS
jgi:hypothetical protein